jgi:deoxyhypusine synthase
MIRKSEHILRKDTVVKEYQLKDKTVKVIESVVLSDKSYEEREREIVDILYDAFLSEKNSSSSVNI